MAKGSNTAAIVILAILALGGLGLSGYMFINDQFFGGDETNLLLAVYEESYGSGISFNISFGVNQLNPSEYFTLSADNETFTFHHEGWYKFTFNTYWTGLLPTDGYVLGVYKNGVVVEHPGYVTNAADSIYALNLEYYLHCDVDDSIYFKCNSVYGDSFSMPGEHSYDQIILEYIITE